MKNFGPQKLKENSFDFFFVLSMGIDTETSALLDRKINIGAENCLDITERSYHWTIVSIADTRRTIWIVIQKSSADSWRFMYFDAIRYVIEANHLKNTFNHARLNNSFDPSESLVKPVPR